MPGADPPARPVAPAAAAHVGLGLLRSEPRLDANASDGAAYAEQQPAGVFSLLALAVNFLGETDHQSGLARHASTPPGPARAPYGTFE